MTQVLLSGCSFSDYCGWGRIGDHSNPQCWYNIVAEKHQVELTNIAYGGQSNRLIIHRASQEVLSNPGRYQAIILQLTSTQRQWFFRKNDRADFCIVNGGNVSNARTPEEEHALYLIQLEFSNRSVEVEEDLVSLLLLQEYCKQHNIKLVLVNGMDAGTAMVKNAMGRYLDLSYSIGFDKSLHAQQVDYADDDLHPGIASNQLYADLVGAVFNKITF